MGLLASSPIVIMHHVASLFSHPSRSSSREGFLSFLFEVLEGIFFVCLSALIPSPTLEPPTLTYTPYVHLLHSPTALRLPQVTSYEYYPTSFTAPTSRLIFVIWSVPLTVWKTQMPCARLRPSPNWNSWHLAILKHSKPHCHPHTSSPRQP